MASSEPGQPMSLPTRYVLSASIGQGGMGEVFRAQDRLSGQVVALKKIKLALPPGSSSIQPASQPASAQSDLIWAATQVSAPAPVSAHTLPPSPHATDVTLGVLFSPSASTQELRRFLTQEFRTLASLRHPNIVSVLDHGFGDDLQPFFTMELLENAMPLTAACRPLPLSQRGELLLQVLEALTYLHRRGILHRDLKPSNILVVGSGRGLRVKLLDFGIAVFKRSGDKRQREVAGTLGYMAPEVLTGGAASEAADLYSLGVMAFEILSGQSLVSAHGATELIAATLDRGPDFAQGGLPERIATVVSRLLARQPEARYESAQLAAQALAQALELPPPVETVDVRESLLGAAMFVGRDIELGRLRDHLAAARRGQGRMVLIGGESGVGKSRLLDEVRILALVAGMRVLRGQAVSDVGTGYGLFIDALRAQSLSEPLEPQEAAVLSGLLPDLPMLLGRAVDAAVPLDAQAARLRLVQTIEAVLLRASQPTLLILEDVHWTSADGLELLSRLSSRVQERSLLILGSYRSEERPELPTLLPSSAHLIVKRLSRAALAELTTAILGNSIDPQNLADLLHRETEGNALFAIEVVRNLALEAGGLAGVGRGELPAQVLAGGMAGALDRRLARVPVAAQRLLRLAAVSGRQIDLGVLGVLVPTLESDLRACADVAVLEVSEDRWRFAHDKLRERLLAQLLSDERQALHRQVAGAIEQLYPNGGGGQAARLAFHYEQSGNLRQGGHYAALAGEQALARGALGEACALLERALRLMQQVGAARLDEVKVRRLLVSALFGLGRYDACTDSFFEALAVLGRPFPDKPMRLFREILSQVGLQLLHRSHRRWIRRPETEEARVELQETTQLFRVGFEALIWMSKQTEGVHSILNFLNLAERTGNAALANSACTALAYGLSMTPLSGLSYYYLDLAAQLQPEISPDGADELFRLRGNAAIGIMLVDHERARRSVANGMALAEKLGDLYAQMFLLTIQYFVQRMDGGFAEAHKTCELLLSLARRTDNAFFLGLGLVFAGGLELRLGRLSAATAHLAAALQPEQVGTTRTAAAGLLALGRLREGDLAAAARLAALALDEFSRSPVTTAVGAEAMPATVEVFLSLWRWAEQPSERAALLRTLRRAQRVLHRYSGAVRIARPVALLHQAQLLWETEEPVAARRQGEAARALAERLRLPYEAALADSWLSASDGAGRDPAREEASRRTLQAFGIETDWLPPLARRPPRP